MTPLPPCFFRLVFDPLLEQEVIYSSTPLQKEIIVDPGTKVNSLDRFKDPRLVDPGQGGSKWRKNFQKIKLFRQSLKYVYMIFLYASG